MKQAEREYQSRVRSLGCVVCRNLGQGDTPASLHHIRDGQGLSQRASHFLVIPLCPFHHQTGGYGNAFHAGEKVWEGLYGAELELLAQTIREVMSCTFRSV